MERNIKLLIEYDGTNYCGWQEQANKPTIQKCLQESILLLTGEKVSVIGSGRTDSGVHAIGQVANFKTNSKILASHFAKALNAHLPKDIVIKEVTEVDLQFHAQFCAKAKAYSYRIWESPYRPAIQKNYFHWIWHSVDISKMKQASQYLIGKHDFCSFEASNSPRKSTIRTVNYIDIQKENCYIKIQMEADGFLYRMVRNIVGTLIYVGTNKYHPEYVIDILKSKDRKLAAPTVPAKGLFLEYVHYAI